MVDNQLTIQQLRDEIELFQRFFSSNGFLIWKTQLEGDKDRMVRLVFDSAPQQLGDILNREQMIGQKQFIDDQLVWFESWVESLQQTLANQQTNITSTNTPDE